jgi:hypothetical protein
MKKIIPALAVLIYSTLLLNSCAVSNNSIALQNKNNVTEGPVGCFVQFNNGTIKQFTTLKLVTGVLTTPHLLGDGKVVINAKEIIAYQNNRHYAVSSKILSSLKSANVAVETLPGFAVKIISGKLNVYSRKYYNGANSAEEYFLQSGNDGYIVSYSKEALISLLKEDAKASEFFNSKVKSVSGPQKILAAIEMYNNGQLMTKN